jgi:hypothetical protein
MKNINQSIKLELLANPKIDIHVLANKYNVSTMTIGANKTTLVRQGLLERANTIEKVDKVIEEQISPIDKIVSAYELAKQKGENTYKNHNGENKENARVKMTNYIVNSGVTGTIATLPNTEWIIEQKIDSQVSGNDFIGVECHKPTFDTMKSNLKKLKLKAKTIFGKIGSIIFGKLENTYAHLILDYCGNLVTFCKEIEYIILNDVIKVGGIMAITFSKPIRGTDILSEMIKSLAPINNTDERCMSDKGVEAYFNKITGFKYQVLEFYYYADKKVDSNGNGYPMTLVIIKRIK